MTVDIWIKVNDDEFKRLDLFEDEEISINDSIQDIRDIQKVFVPYSSDIIVPASKDNNTVFKHYYNNDIDGFDGRFLVDSYITIDGYIYKEGKLRLEKAIVKDNEVYSYNLRFFGDTIELTELIGDDELKELDLSQYNFVFSSELVKSGFQFTSGHLTWPFVSTKNYYYYSTGNNGAELKFGIEGLPDNARNRNVNADIGWEFQGVDFYDLKPAIRVEKLIRAIESRYGITFTNHFFDVNDPKWNDLHLWLDREKGQLIGNTITNGELRVKFDDSEIAPLTSTDVRTSGNESVINNTSGTNAGRSQFWDLRITGILVDQLEEGEEFTVEVIEGISGQSITGELTRTGKRRFSDLANEDKIRARFQGFEDVNGNIQPIVIVRSATVTQVKFVDLRLHKMSVSTNLNDPNRFTTKAWYEYQYNNGALSDIVYTGIVSELVPEMKIIDFLTSIWKTFNLTAYKNDDGEIEVKSLTEYYSSGSILDLTEYVDTSNIEYERSTLYKSIELKNRNPKVWANKQFDNIFTGESFGDFEVRFDDRNTFTKDYKIQTNFGRIIYERMSNQRGNNELTDYQWGWAVDDNKNSVQTDPTLMYCTTQSISGVSTSITYDNGVTREYLSQYVKPSNVHPDTGDSLSFGTEIDEWTHTDTTSSLYDDYYRGYIEDTFDNRSRIVRVSAKLPSTILLEYKLNDTVRIQDKDYTINTLSSNLSTGETQLELLTKL